MTLKEISRNRHFDGDVVVFEHISESCQGKMAFSVYLPSKALSGESLPAIFFLSGLTCTWENFTTKAGAQKYASEHQVILIAPDTSPRDVGVNIKDDAWDLGTGAGFYVDATEEPWKKNFQMFTYITEELFSLVTSHFPVDSKRIGIMGHSMGGHGALVIGLRCPQKFRSISAFSPIGNPINSVWGQKAFSSYLGANKNHWRSYDATILLEEHAQLKKKILIDQGLSDSFFDTLLQVKPFIKACAKYKQPIDYRTHKGYDHSYYFVSTFIGDHIAHHLQVLNSTL